MFDLLRFGDNDTVTADDNLTMGYERADETIQNIKIPYPNGDENDANSIRQVMQNALNNQIFLDSKTGDIMTSDTAKVFTAYMTNKTTRELDLS